MSDSGYVFEVLETDPVFPGCVGFRRADLQSVQARDALILLLQSHFQIELDQVAFDESLKGILPDSPFLMVAPRPKWLPPIGNPIFVAHMEREPGKGNENNPVITNLQQITSGRWFS
jgi:hypothetical protein